MSSHSRQALNTVLCIGGDPIPLNLRCAALRVKGWQVVSSGSGHEGLIRFGEGPVGLVVLDLNGDGVEAALIAGELKRLRPGVRVVILVEKSAPLSEISLRSADAVVLKSEEGTALVAALRTIRHVPKAEA